MNTIAGADPPLLQGGITKVRLFVSTTGAFEVPLSTAVSTTIVDPLLKLAWLEQQSPKTLNSALFQLGARLTQDGFETRYSWVAVDIVTVSPLLSVRPVRLS